MDMNPRPEFFPSERDDHFGKNSTFGPYKHDLQESCFSLDRQIGRGNWQLVISGVADILLEVLDFGGYPVNNEGKRRIMGVSLREYARLRGTTLSTVQKAIKSGRITLEADKTVDVAKADAQWRENTDTTRHPKLSEGQDVGFEAGVETKKVSNFQQARTAGEYYRAMLVKERLKKARNEVVDRHKVNEHVFKLARTARDAILNWPARDVAIIASELGVDEHKARVILDERIRQLLTEIGEIAKSL